MSGSPSANDRLEQLGLWYGGRGIAGEFYVKELGNGEAITMATECNERQSWTADDLEAIAAHKRMIDRTENPGVGGSIPPLPI